MSISRVHAWARPLIAPGSRSVTATTLLYAPIDRAPQGASRMPDPLTFLAVAKLNFHERGTHVGRAEERDTPRVLNVVPRLSEN